MATVMIVDNAKATQIKLGDMLKKLDHEIVAQTDSAYGAVIKYQKYQPQIVIMNITMPSEDLNSEVENIKESIDAVKKIIMEFPNAKIIITAQEGEQQKVIKAIQEGASHYLLKPIDSNQLKEVINQLL